MWAAILAACGHFVKGNWAWLAVCFGLLAFACYENVQLARTIDEAHRKAVECKTATDEANRRILDLHNKLTFQNMSISEYESRSKFLELELSKVQEENQALAEKANKTVEETWKAKPFTSNCEANADILKGQADGLAKKWSSD